MNMNFNKTFCSNIYNLLPLVKLNLLNCFHTFIFIDIWSANCVLKQIRKKFKN